MFTLEAFQSATLTAKAGDLFNPPGLTNFFGCLQAACDVMAIQHLTFPPFSHGDAVIGGLTMNGRCIRTSGLPIEFRWRPDRIERRVTVGGFELSTTTVMGVRDQSVTIEMRITNTLDTDRDACVEIATGEGVIQSIDGWKTPYSPKEGPSISTTPWEGTPPAESLVRNRCDVLPGRAGVCYASQRSAAFSLQATHPAPTRIDRRRLVFEWHLAGGESRVLHFLVTVGECIEKVNAQHGAWLPDPSRAIRAAESDWRKEVAAVFVPGNDRYSGHLPTFHSTNGDLLALYRSAVIGVVYFKRISPAVKRGRTYTTLMPRYWVTTSVINDWSLSAWLLAMLDPACLRETVELWLERGIHRHFGTEYVSDGNAGNWYSCNDFAMTRLIAAYLRVTGDFDWLQRRAGGQTVLEHLKAMATHHRALDRGSGLADYGDRNSLLECVGSYTHEVASLNAANVWILREVGALFEHLGRSDEASALRREAHGLASRVQQLYVEGGGYWCCRQPDGELVPVRHAWDFVHVLNLMMHDLTPTQIEEMVRFFEGELMTPTWMAGLSSCDADVDFSLRPDHQWNGCYPGWVGLALCALARVGRWDLLERWLPGLARSADQGPFSQAHFVEAFAPLEHGGARKAPTEWPFINDWAILCVGGFLEFIVLHLFGIEFGHDRLEVHSRMERIDPLATLENVPFHGRVVNVLAGGDVSR